MDSLAKPSLHRQAIRYSTHMLFETTAKEILDGLTLVTSSTNVNIPSQKIENTTENTNSGAVSSNENKAVVVDRMFCSCCQAPFVDREEQIGHYKCDWHRYNLHRRLKALPCVTEEEFEDAAGDVSSISGSDDEDEDDDALEAIEKLDIDTAMPDTANSKDEGNFLLMEPKFHKVFFKTKEGELISLYRCLLHHKKNPLHETNRILAAVSQLPEKKLWIILMVSSGHFAGAVFHGKEVIDHKTFHRYTVRAKRGTAQSAKDGQGGAPKSAGASLRRYNESALVQDVQDLLSKWQEHIQMCDFVFVRVPVANRAMFFGGKYPAFTKDDLRINVIPFVTRRPTFSEIKRVHQILSSVGKLCKSAEVRDIIPQSTPRLYNTETGQMIMRKNSPKPARALSKKHPPALHSDTTENDSHEITKDEDKEIDMDLVETLEEIHFSELKQFDCTVKKKHRKKKLPSTTKPNKEKDSYLDEEMVLMKNELFTACKIGCLDSVMISLEKLGNKQSEHAMNCLKDACGKCTTLVQHSQNSEVKNSCESDHTRSESNVNDTVGEDNYVQQTGDDKVDLISSNHPNLSEPSVAAINSAKIPCSCYSVANFLNMPLTDDGTTFLHVAAKEGHAEVVTAILSFGADPSIKNKDGKVPYNVAEPGVRNEFRRFMATFPDRYDYIKAQIPSPLTSEMEAEKKQKAAEKRKAKKKAMNERRKDTKIAEEKIREENQDRDRFLALSEREKRALAAEKRILQQCSDQGLSKPVLSRCWQCGSDMTGKLPFEYFDYKFCTTKCLREHRSKLSATK